MRYLSLFSGIEAATVAWHPLGWECAAVAEIEPFPCAVLAHHYPDVPNLGDVTTLTEEQIAALGHIDLVVFGSPCQDLSVAGKRAGLQGERSGLFFTAVKIVEWARKNNGTRFALWENVPGAFSSNRGADFAVVVGELAGAAGIAVPPKGWGTEGALVGQEGMVEWATLDAQWFGVAQRRRRVFAFADFGDWAGRCPVLLEPESLRGDSAPSREQGQSTTHTTAPCLRASGLGVERGGDTRGQDAVIAVGGLQRPSVTAFGGNNTSHAIDVATAVRTKDRGDFETETLLVNEVVPVLSFHHNAQVDQMNFSEHTSASLTVSQQAAVMTLAIRGRGDSHELETREDGTANAILTLNGWDERHDPPKHMALHGMQVRRLTPRECERLQGFPDFYTLVLYRGKPAADGPRYKALGNSMAVPVMAWIGDRIELIKCFQ